RERAHLLDDVDLLVTSGLEDDVELVLSSGVLGSRGGRATHSGKGDRSSGGHAEGVFESLHELGELDEGELLERVEQLVSAELRHDGGSFLDGGDRGGREDREG